MAQEVRVIEFDTAVTVLASDTMIHVFTDGVFNQMNLDWGEHREADAREAGYGADWRRFAIEHDLAHHIVADAMGWPWSFALHDGDGTLDLKDAPAPIQQEEAIVVALQRFLRAGERPIIAGVDWDGLRKRAMEVMG